MDHRALAHDNHNRENTTDVCRALVAYIPLKIVVMLVIHVTRKMGPQNLTAQPTARQAGYG